MINLIQRKILYGTQVKLNLQIQLELNIMGVVLNMTLITIGK